MPSVIVQWNGSSVDRAARASLLEKLEKFAVMTQRYYRREHPLAEDAPAVKRYRGTLRGKILLSPDLTDRNEPACVSLVSLEGFEFRVADCRHLYPGEDRVSFIFAHFPEYKALEGALVMIEEREGCDYFLTSPHIHLRVDFEEWMDGFLAWVKHYYVPNLVYWRYGNNPGFDNMKRWPRDADMRDLLWDWLQQAFEREAQRWRPEAAIIRDLLDADYAEIIERGRPFRWLHKIKTV